MGKMIPLSKIISRNKITIPSHPLVAVFVGGTHGIGSYALLALASHHGAVDEGKGLRIYLVGRTEEKVEAIFREARKRAPRGDFRYVECRDASLLREVDGACKRILEMERKEEGGGKIDFLCQSQAIFCLTKGRQETKEGLDTFFSLVYYSRIRFAHNLIPLLLASLLPTGALILSIFAPDQKTTFFQDDISLRDPAHYGFINVGSHTDCLKTLFFEELAKRHEGKLRCIHYFPGLVLDAAPQLWGNDDIPLWMKVLFPILRPVLRFGPTSLGWEECGERVVFQFSAAGSWPARGKVVEREEEGEAAMGSDGVVGGGAYKGNWNGDLIPSSKKLEELRQEKWGKRAWDHTMKVFETIGRGEVYTGC